jgi:hypothetical protein
MRMTITTLINHTRALCITNKATPPMVLKDAPDANAAGADRRCSVPATCACCCWP